MSHADSVRTALERALGKASVQTAPSRFDGPELPLAVPSTEAELVEVLALATREGWRLVPTGLGSKLGWCAPAGQADLMVTTRGLSGVVSYEPGDGTLAALAGTRMADVRKTAAAGGHWVTPDVPRPAARTLGGVLAAAESGPDRQLFGPVRHHVLGMRVALADGTVVRSGGQLVKNVTGYDLHRLYCGSHGTLCVILEAALRLFPAPEHELWITLSVGAGTDPFELARAALAPPARIACLTLARVDPPTGGAEWLLAARLLGLRAPVESDKELLLARWAGAAGVMVVEGAEARTGAEALRDRAFAPEGGAWLAVTCPSPALRDVLAVIDRALGEPAARVLAQPGVATLDVRLDADRVELESLRAELAQLRAQVALRDAPEAMLAGSDPLGARPPGGEWMRRLRAGLDPKGTLATGRVPGVSMLQCEP